VWLCIRLGHCANRVATGTQLVARSRSTSSRKAGIRRTVWDIWRERHSNLVGSNIQPSTSLATKHSPVVMITRFSQIRGRLDTLSLTQMIHTRKSRSCLTSNGYRADNRNMIEMSKIFDRVNFLIAAIVRLQTSRGQKREYPIMMRRFNVKDRILSEALFIGIDLQHNRNKCTYIIIYLSSLYWGSYETKSTSISNASPQLLFKMHNIFRKKTKVKSLKLLIVRTRDLE
jgi:hypothetical protein